MTSGSFYPVADGAKDLGLSGNRWNNVYSEAGNFSGTITCQGSIDLQDNDKLLLGAANDLEIYHDGSNNYINSVIANGDLILDTAQNFYIKHSGETMIQGVNDGAVNLFYNATKTFQTTASGVKLSQSTSYLYGGDDEILAGQDSGGYYFATGNGQNISKPIFIGDNASYIKFKTGDSERVRITSVGNVGINTTSPAYKLDVYGGDARIGTNLRLGNGSAAGNSTNPAITVSGVNTAGVYFENSGVGFGAGSGSKYLFLSSAGNASLGGNGFFKQLGDRPYGTDNLNDYYRSNDEASFCQFYRYDATHGHWANSSGTLTTNAPSTLTQTTSQIYSYGSLLTLRSLSSFRGQFYFAHSASEFYWRSGWGTSSDQNWTRIVGDRNIQTVINNVGTVSIGGASATSGVALSVKGDTEFLDGDTGTRIGLLYDNGTEGILDLRDNNVIKVNLRTAGASYFTGGNVGIGTNAPEAALTVADSTAHQAIFRTAQTTASERAGGGFSSVGSSTATSRYARLFLDADGANFSGTDYFTIEKFGSSGVVKFLQYSNANMSFWVNTSTEALTIWKNGNVGIGTNNPGRELDVDGRILSDSYGFRSDTSVRWYYFDNYSGSNFIGRGGNAYTSLYDGGTLSMAWKAGSVGIGTASPSATLHAVGTVTDNSSAEITRIQGASSSGSTNTHLRFTAASSSSTAANRWFGLQVYDHNPTARALALQHLGGNVGIGTNAPSQKLHVIGAAFIDNTGASGGLTVEASSEARIILQAAQNTAYHAKLSAHYNYTTPMTLSGYGGTVLAQNTGYNKTLLYAANAEQIRITTTGVGIGLGGSDPNAKLEVKSDGSAAGGAEIRLTHDNNNSTDVVSTVNFANNIGSVAMIQGGTTGANNTGYISFFTDSTGTSGERMRIQGNGYVGIGTATAYSPLQVYSSADQKILLSGSANPYIRWQNGGSNRAYIQWVESSNSLSFFNSAGDNFDFYTHDSSVLAIRLKGNDGDNWGYVYAEEGTSQAHAVGFLDGDGAWAARHVKDTSWDFRINNSTKMFIDSNGDVGIGTDNPLSNLHVNYSSGVTDIKAGFLSGTAGPGIRGQNTSTTANTYFPIDFRCNDADARIAFQYSGTSNQGQLLFITEAHSTSPKLGIYDRGTVARVLVNDTTSTGTPTKTFEVKYVSTSTDVTQEGLSGGGVGKGLLIYNTQESNNVYANIDFRARNADGRIAYQYQTATNVGDFHFITDNIGSPQSMMVIKNDGKVGIGTNNPAAHLHINKTSGTTTVLTQVAANSTVGFEIKKTGSTTQHWKIVDGQTINGTLEFYDATDSVTRMAVKGDGNVGVGTANPTSRLDIRSVQAAGDSNGSNLACINLETFNSNSSEYGSYLKCKNYVGGGSGPNWKIGGIEGYWTTNKVASIDFMAGDDWYNPGNKDEGEIAFTVYNNTGSGSTAIEAMRIHQTGNIGIGSTNPGSKLTVNGSLSASSKSFLIDHPTKENKKLEHGCLEGPEFGVYHRGTTQSNTITLPDYWSGLVREDTVTVQLTPRGGFQHLYVVSTSLSQIVIGAADGESIDCFYTIYGERADIDSLVVEKDV